MTSTNHNPSAVTGDGKIAVTGAAENTDGNGLTQSGDPTTTIGAATTPGATANLPASSAPAKGPALVVGQILSGKINKVLEYGALVDLDNGPTTLMNTEAMSGGTFDNRKARRDTLKRGDEVAVEVLRIRPPKPGTKQWRINVSERVLQERAIREQLHGGTDTEPGSIVVGKVKELKDYGVLIEATEGPAIGYSCLLHAVEVSLGDRDERDNFLEALEVGQMIEAEVLAIEEPEKPGHDLRIKLTLVAGERRELKQTLSDTNRVFRGVAGKSDRDGLRVEFGSRDCPMVGILPNGEVPAATKFGDTVRVRIARNVNGRITLTRKGIK